MCAIGGGAGFPGHPPNADAGQGIFGYCHKPTATTQQQQQDGAAQAQGGTEAAPVVGSLDGVWPNEDGTVAIRGWAVDTSAPGQSLPNYKSNGAKIWI